MFIVVVVTQLFVFEIMNSYELNFLSGNATFCVFVRCSRESLKKGRHLIFPLLHRSFHATTGLSAKKKHC